LIDGLPSPKFQPQVKAPVPPEAVVARATALPTSVGLGEAVGVVTLGAGFTATTTVFADDVTPRLSVALTLTVKDPVAV
jgi:hypothetical protein